MKISNEANVKIKNIKAAIDDAYYDYWSDDIPSDLWFK